MRRYAAVVHSHDVAVAIIAVVAAIALALTFLAVRAWRSTGNRKLAFVAAAFAAFVAKSVLTAYSLRTSLIDHEDLELVGSLFDLAIVVLLVSPFLVGPRQP